MANFKNKTIGVFFGGKSAEHDVSIVTGQLIIDNLRKNGYGVVPVYIGKDGVWYVDEKLGSLKFFLRGEYSADLAGLARYSIDLMASQKEGALILRKKGLLGAKEVRIDIALPALHGANGEDGTIQGMFEMLGVPYAGCGVAASAVAIDKIMTKTLCQGANLPIVPFVSCVKNLFQDDEKKIIAQIENKLKYPLFVKPARCGSSIGISKVKKPEDLRDALDLAFHYDDAAIVENGVDNMKDLTCAVLGDGDNIQTSLVQESEFAQDFFSYEDKYISDGGAQFGNAKQEMHIPARIDDAATQAVQKLSKEVFALLGCTGTARVDFLYDTDNDKVYINEINTLPGTLYHHLWKESGVSLEDIIQSLLQDAQIQQGKRNALIHDFPSDILKLANSVKLQMGEK